MQRKYLFFSFALVLIMMLTGCVNSGSAPQGVNGGTLTGTVVDSSSGLSLWSGQASIAGKKAQISGGKFEIKNIPFGTHTLTVAKPHYQDKKIQVTIDGRSTAVEVKLQCVYSQGHLDLFARLVHAESRGEPYEGQVAVAASILNRVLHRNYPNTLYGDHARDSRCYAQYSPVDDGSINNGWPKCQRCRERCPGMIRPRAQDFAPAKVPNRRNRLQQVPIVQIGNHLFSRAN